MSGSVHDGVGGAGEARDWFGAADAALPGGGLGGFAVPADARLVIRRGEGSRIQDADGRWYVDYVCGAGASVLGHGHPAVLEAVASQAARGLHFFGSVSEPAVALAEVLVEAIPCAERILYATTGSEATFYAMRLARAATGRSKILKFEGGYHGNHDYALFSTAPSAPANYPVGQADTAGIPEGVQPGVLVSPFNDLESAERLIAANRDDLAAVIVEPVQRIIFPREGFLAGLRRICDANGVLLIFDELVTGFRLAWGGAQEYFGVTPDLATYGKIIGGGGPVACVAGPAALIDLADPARKGRPDFTYVNGTLHGNPMAAAAGLATLRELRRPGFHADLHARADAVCAACQQVLDRHGLPAIAAGRASLWQILFLRGPPASHADVLASDRARAAALDVEQLRGGLYVLPGIRRFVSAAHTDEDVERTVEVLDAACEKIARA